MAIIVVQQIEDNSEKLIKIPCITHEVDILPLLKSEVLINADIERIKSVTAK